MTPDPVLMKLSTDARAAQGTKAHPRKIRAFWRHLAKRHLERVDLRGPTKNRAANRAFALAALLRDELDRARATRNAPLAAALAPMHEAARLAFSVASRRTVQTLTAKAGDDATAITAIVAALRSILEGKATDPKAALSKVRELARGLSMPPVPMKPAEGEGETIDGLVRDAIAAIGTDELRPTVEDLLAIFTAAVDEPAPAPAAQKAAAQKVAPPGSEGPEYAKIVRTLRHGKAQKWEPILLSGLRRSLAIARQRLIAAHYQANAERDRRFGGAEAWNLKARTTLAAKPTEADGKLPEEEILGMLRQIASGGPGAADLVTELEAVLEAVPPEALPSPTAPDVADLIGPMRAALEAKDDAAVLEAIQACAEAYGLGPVTLKAGTRERLCRTTLALAITKSASGGAATEFRIWRRGTNPTSNGYDVLFDDAAARAVMAAYRAHGVDVMIDLEHLSLDDRSPNHDPDARGWCHLELRNGELWAVNVRWTSDGARRLQERTQRYMSPAFALDDENRPTRVFNLALVAMPGTDATAPLAASWNRNP